MPVVKLQPGDLGKGRAIRPWVCTVFSNRLDGRIAAEDQPQCLIVKAIGGTDRFPVLVVGQELDSVRRRCNRGRRIRASNPLLLLLVVLCEIPRRYGGCTRGRIQIVLQ